MTKDEINMCKMFYDKVKNYRYNLAAIERNRLKYEEVINDLYGVKSVVAKDIILENAGDPKHTWNQYLADKKDELILERAALLYDTVCVDKVLNSIPNIEVVDMIKECYMNRRMRHEDVAMRHNRSKPKMYRDMNRAVLEKIKHDKSLLSNRFSDI